METNVLRIGNYIIEKYSHWGRPKGERIIEVESVLEKGINYDWSDDHSYIGADDLKPIPLTEEWLFKFGLCHEGKAFGRLKLDCEFGEVEIWLNGKNPLCKYVHQLQNLYFALTGNELGIKETI